MYEIELLKSQIGKKLTEVKALDDGYFNEEDDEFPKKILLSFEDGNKIEISYLCYPEGSSWLTITKPQCRTI